MKRRARTLTLIAGLAGAALASGCYTRVIEAEGYGSDRLYPTRYQSNEPEIDKAIDKVITPRDRRGRDR